MKKNTSIPLVQHAALLQTNPSKGLKLAKDQTKENKKQRRLRKTMFC